MKGKKPASTLLVAILALGMALVSVGAQTPTPKFFVNPSAYTATQLGEVFTIDIKIANITYGICVINFTLGYNTTLLDAIDVKVPYPPARIIQVKINETQGYVRVHLECYPIATGPGTLATITFQATYAKPASCTLDLYNTVLEDLYGPVPHDVKDGYYEFVIPITVATDKTGYLPGENVRIRGNVTLPHDALVALEVDYPDNDFMVVRTLQTGPSPPPGNITIIVYPCDMLGRPKESFSKGGYVYFNVTAINSGTDTKYVTITINAYDNNTVPFRRLAITQLLLPGLTSGGRLASLLIPEWASLGTAKGYASAFTDYPRDGGTPYCPEKSAKFTITGSTLGAGALETQGSGNSSTPANYSLTFKLAPNAMNGIYKVYATTFYKRSIMSRTAFGIKVIRVPDHYPTIQRAINAATPTNNSILVLPRTYNENVIVNKTVILVGVDPTSTIINGSGTGTVLKLTSNNSEISRFTIQNGDKGIALNNSSQSTISENTILENYYGVYLNHYSQDNTIQSNTITSNNGYGIITNASDNNDITNNALSNNRYGIYLNHSTNCKLRKNKMTCNKYNFAVFGDSTSDFGHDIDTSNTVDGKPIIYWVNRYNSEVPSNAGFVAIVSSTKIAIRGLNLTKNGQGVLFAFTSNSLIERVNVTGNEYGIYLVNSLGNKIVGSRMSNNTVGIYQSYSNENIIWHNNFTHNTNQVNLYQSSNNTWDDSAGKGNYWSDYTGADDGSNNRTASDGVGDTLLPHQGVDWYPLMNPYILVHDTAVINVTAIIPFNGSWVYPGAVVSIYVTIKNEGDYTESSLKVIAYYNGNLIKTKTITEITPQNVTVITIDWNTAGVAEGNYIISVNASIVPGEIETTDNTLVDGTVKVKKVGDVNGDGRVGIIDVILTFLNWGTVPPKDPVYDVNGDGTVNITDVIIVFLNWR